jgi:chromosomal replication initiation ATPase DnaA
VNDGLAIGIADVYSIIDHRLLGDEDFVEEVAKRFKGDVKKERWKKERSLPQIAAAVETRYQITLDQMRSWSRRPGALLGRRVFSLVAKEYGYKGKGIGEYLKKDPAAVTGYVRKGDKLQAEVEKVIADQETESN